MPQEPVDLVIHPKLGPLRFPKSMPFAERNRLIEAMEAAPPQITETHEQAKERIRVAGQKAEAEFAGSEAGPGTRFVRGVFGTEPRGTPTPEEELTTELGQTLAPVMPGAPLIAGPLREILEARRMGAGPIEAAASGIVSPVVNPSALRGAFQRLGQGDVAGAAGELAPTAAMVAVGEAGRLSFGRGKPIPHTTVGTEMVVRETAEVAPFMKQELVRIAEESASEIAKRPIKATIATVAGKPSVDAYVEGISEVGAQVKDIGGALFKQIDRQAGGIFINVPAETLTPKQLTAAGVSGVGTANVSLSEAIAASQALRKSLFKARDANTRRLLGQQKMTLDDAITTELSAGKYPQLAPQIKEAKALWRKGSAIEDFSDEVLGHTTGMAEFESNVPGAKRVFNARKFVEQIKGGGEFRPRLEDAVGHKRAQHVAEVADLMSRVEDPAGFLGMMGYVYLRAKGPTVFDRLSINRAVFEDTGRFVLSKGMLQSQSQYYLRNALINFPKNTARATFWMNRYVDQVMGESPAERLRGRR